jgi:hypothetical protein
VRLSFCDYRFGYRRLFFPHLAAEPIYAPDIRKGPGCSWARPATFQAGLISRVHPRRALSCHPERQAGEDHSSKGH